MKSSMICTLHQLLLGDQIEKNEVDGACNTYGGWQRCIQDFGREAGGKETTCKTKV